MENSYRKFTRDIVAIGAVNILTVLASLVILSLLTKNLGEHDYGIWSQVTVSIGLLIGVVGLGLPFAMTRFLAAKTNKYEIQEDFYSVLIVVTLFTSIIVIPLFLLAEPIAGALFGGATQIVRITCAIIVISALNNVGIGLFRAFRQMGRYSLFTLIDILGGLGLIAFLILTGHDLKSAVLALLVAKVIALLAIFFHILRKISPRKPQFSRIREYLRFGLPTIPADFSVWLVASSDIFVIGYFLGVTSVGIYSVGYSIAAVPLIVAGIIGFVLPATVSKLYDEGKMDEVKTHLSYSLKYFLALAIPFVFGAFVLAEPVIEMFSTQEAASQGKAITTLVALSSLSWGIYAVVVNVLILVKKTRILAIVWIAAGLVNLLLNIMIVPSVGIVGAAVTTLIAYSLALAITVYYSLKEFSFSIDWRFIFKSLAASVVMSLVVWWISPAETSSVLLAIAIGIMVYAAFLLLLKAITREEYNFFKRFFLRRP